MPCWVEDQQSVSLVPSSELQPPSRPLIPHGNDGPRSTRRPQHTVIFPLCPDHLIILLQYNVLRASAANRRLISGLFPNPANECSSAALRVVPSPSPHDGTVPPSLRPTALQMAIPHEGWVDIIPDPAWRDNVLLAMGRFDEDDLWADTIGGLFDGFPHSEIERRGVIAWWPPWDAAGWEVSEGFWRKWRWSFKGCQDVLDATNKWRAKRGEEPLVFDV